MYTIQEEYGLKTIKDLVQGEKNLSRIFGFILYTNEHPYMVKVLKDSAYWNALDSFSGSNWPIFAVRPLEQGHYGFPPRRGNDMQFMVMTWNEPQTNIPILKDFGLESSKSLPCFVAFIWDDNDELQSISIPIKGNNEETVYNSLEEIVKAVAKAEQNVRTKYKHNVELFRNVSDELKALDCKLRLNTIIEKGRKFIEFFRLFI